ncbi:SDR family oxidoreductase [Frankia sp. R82]|uniref:SDR family oxidoreductase n=1 Tax=Frankia sp. R82 TaxID=2950553 RepID=UPI002043C237|nr:SDR family oxidoreductase [Frankia sp. R82]MCM3884877.1 SDR family oxidoreductase [Frankia sp. R82]
MKAVVFGASGVVGRAAAEQFAARPGGAVVAVSRRPVTLPGVEHVVLDLADRSATEAAIRGGAGAFAGVTHVVYAALQEGPDLVAGWRDPDLMQHNLRLFRNALEPLLAAHGDTLRHVSLLQGAKAYGLHLGRTPVPAKERAPRDQHDNFYFLQEDALRSLAADAGWSWTILRPQVVLGESIGSPMNLLPAIGVYASLERARGRALAFPGGPPTLQEAVDARLLARALDWAADSPAARFETFNVTNGDVYTWHDVWPAIADACGMDVADPEPQLLAQAMPPRRGEWAALVDAHSLRAPREMADFVGSSWSYADVLFGARGTRALPALLSTIRIRSAGFGDCIDTEDMLRAWFDRFQRTGLLPKP